MSVDCPEPDNELEQELHTWAYHMQIFYDLLQAHRSFYLHHFRLFSVYCMLLGSRFFFLVVSTCFLNAMF